MKKGIIYTLLIIVIIGLSFSLNDVKRIATDAGAFSDYDSTSSYDSNTYDSDSTNNRSSHYNYNREDTLIKRIKINHKTTIIIIEIITLIFLVIKELIMPSSFTKTKKVTIYLIIPLLTIIMSLFINENIAFVVIIPQLILLISLKWVKNIENIRLKRLLLLICYAIVIILFSYIFDAETYSMIFLYLGVGAFVLNGISSIKIDNSNNELTIIEGEPILPAFNNFGIYGDQKAVNIFYNLFYEVQMAWMNFDYTKLKELCSDELYNSLRRELEEIEKKKEKNIMKDFKVNKVAVIEMNNYADKLEIVMMLDVSFYDYIIDKHKFVIRGSSTKKINNIYNLTYQKKYERLDNCPSCGAKVTSNLNSNCEYCGSILINNNKDFVLSLINKVS